MKTPISYYGGKQLMLADILPLIPSHEVYLEVFCGGAAVFWAKTPSNIEIINDNNGEVVNFYRVLQTEPERLFRLIKGTLHSRDAFADSKHIYQRPHLFSKIRRAWAFWVQTSQSFGSSPGGTWGFQKKHKNMYAKKVHNAVERFTYQMAKRLEGVSIENTDALDVIKRFDAENAFFYVDPPYFNADMGHYGGYTESDFKGLLNVLSQIKGKFLLSSYRSDILTEYICKYKWSVREIDKKLSMARGKRKIEVLTANYSWELSV